MALFQPALQYTLGWENSKQHPYVPNPDAPKGSWALAGINSAKFPDDYARISAMETASPAQVAAVSDFYDSKFWSQWLAGLESQDVANRVFDMGVNGGVASATRILQRCVCSMGQHVVVDGVMGSLTVMAANQIDPQKLLAAYRVARVSHYEDIAEAKPEDEPYLENWELRARA